MKAFFKGIFSLSVSLRNNIYFAITTFRDSLFAKNQSLIRLSPWFDVSNRVLYYCRNKIGLYHPQKAQDQEL